MNAAKIEANKPDYQDATISGNPSSASPLIGLAGPESERQIISLDLRGKTTEKLFQITKDNYANAPENKDCKLLLFEIFVSP